MTACWPSWHSQYSQLVAAGSATINSGCATVNGNVTCRPEDMRAQAERVMGVPVSLEAYTLARYMQSEVGTGTIEERVAVGEAAVNRGRLEKGLLQLLLYRQSSGHANYGWYGPIHGGSTATAPYGRWAATSKDPTVGTMRLALLIMSGGSGNFNRGADDQNGLQYYNDPEGDVRKKAAAKSYWVGPLPGVDPWHTFLYRKYGYSMTSPEGMALLNRGLNYVSQRKRVGSKWASTLPTENPTCTAFSGGAIVGFFLLGSAALAGAIYAGRVVALRRADSGFVAARIASE